MTYTFQPEIYELMYNPTYKRRFKEAEKKLNAQSMTMSKATNI